MFLHIYVVHGGAIWWHVAPVCQGYDSIVFNPGDGNEIVIWDKHRVKSMRRKAALLQPVSVPEISRDLSIC